MSKYKFYTNHIVLMSGSTYKVSAIDVEANSPEEAHDKALPQFPEGSKLFCWYLNEPEDAEN